MLAGRMAVTALAVTLHRIALADVTERLKALAAQSTDSSHSLVLTQPPTTLTLSRCTPGKILLTSSRAA